MFHIVLYQPEIPPNTGNIIRLCTNTGFKLHLIKPLGFDISDKSLRRAGMDYLERTSFEVHDNLEEFLKNKDTSRIFLCTTKAQTIYCDPKYKSGDIFIFGSESSGLPGNIHSMFPHTQKIKIPMTPQGRSLNLAVAVGVIAYEAWKSQNFT